MDQDYMELCAVQFASDARVSEAASALVLAQSGVLFSDEDVERLADNLSHVAAERGLCPEEVQSALQYNEPILRASTLDF